VLHVPKNAIGNKIIVGFSDGRVSLFIINPMLTEGSLRLLDVVSHSIVNDIPFHSLQLNKKL
jgi:hypothetical protein